MHQVASSKVRVPDRWPAVHRQRHAAPSSLDRQPLPRLALALLFQFRKTFPLLATHLARLCPPQKSMPIVAMEWRMGGRPWLPENRSDHLPCMHGKTVQSMSAKSLLARHCVGRRWIGAQRIELRTPCPSPAGEGPSAGRMRRATMFNLLAGR